MKTDSRKGYNIDKEINRCKSTNYRALCIEMNGKNSKWDYDREEYCKILKEVANSYADLLEYKADFQVLFYAEVYETGKKDYDNNEERDCSESRRKKIARIHNRLLEGKAGSTATATDKTCYDFLKEVQERFKKSLLTEIKEPFYYENKYLYTLASQLIEIMYGSDIFNYVPDSSNFQSNCYRNHLRMIENNIKEIFGNDMDIYSKWMEIITPFQHLIYNCDYPGIKKGDIWYCKCEELRFFDCSYEIAKNYELYCKVKEKLAYDLGDTREEVNRQLQEYDSFKRKDNNKDEKELFCNMMLNTFKKIITDEFSLNV